MRNLTDRELKAVEKFRAYSNCAIAYGVSNGTILEMIRYAKKLKLKKECKFKPDKRGFIERGI